MQSWQDARQPLELTCFGNVTSDNAAIKHAIAIKEKRPTLINFLLFQNLVGELMKVLGFGIDNYFVSGTFEGADSCWMALG